MSRWVDMDVNPCYKCRLVEKCIPWERDKKCIDHDNWFKGADVAPVKHGHWITDEDTYICGYICSVCERWIPPLKDANYCPRCGAKMKNDD